MISIILAIAIRISKSDDGSIFFIVSLVLDLMLVAIVIDLFLGRTGV